MAGQPVTIAVIPGERFSLAKRSLESILAHRAPATELVYIDGGSPPLVRQYLEQQAARRGFRLISTERHVSPNVARNLAAAQVRTKYLALVNGDVVVSAGWLAPLVACAESTDAWIVGSVCCHDSGPQRRILAAGGTAEIVSDGPRRVYFEQHRLRGRSLASFGATLGRRRVGQIELHATLLRTDLFDRFGPLDEQLASGLEHTDLCLTARSRGGRVYLEGASVVTVDAAAPLEPSDLPYFQQRYSDAWIEATIARFREKWKLAGNDPALSAIAAQLAEHRRTTLEPFRRVLRLCGRAPAQWIEKVLIAPFEQAANRRKFPAAPHIAEPQWRKAA